MTKRIPLSAALLSAALAVVAFAAEHPKGHEHPGAAPAAPAAPASAKAGASWEGEIVDLVCYLGGNKMSGAKHAKCAKSCVVGEKTPAGLLTTDGTLYLLIEEHGKGAKAYSAACKLAGEKAKVSGRMVKEGGLNAIVVSGAEKMK